MQTLLAQQPVFFYAAVGLLGLIAGSFLNVVIMRLPHMLAAQWRASVTARLGTPANTSVQDRVNLAWPRSFCPHCMAPIKAWHNIPVVSFIWLRGRCAACGGPISWRYPVVEIAATAIALAVAARFGATPLTGFALLFSWGLLALAVIDWQTQLLPDTLTLGLLWLGLLASLGYRDGAALVAPAPAIVGAALGYGVLWLIFWLFFHITGKEGMGYGDFKLLAAIGAWLGWQRLPLVLLLAALAGAIAGGALMVSGRLARGAPMPFGPWLAAAGWLGLVAGDTIMRVYLSLVGLNW
jgi:leader peptidase (prepilin peptidase)/N-methyltransferase